MYHYAMFMALGGALVALAITELWFLRLKEEEPDEPLPAIPDFYRRHIPVLSPDDTPLEADRFIRAN